MSKYIDGTRIVYWDNSTGTLTIPGNLYIGGSANVSTLSADTLVLTSTAINIGSNAGVGQQAFAVAIGYGAGCNTQGGSNVAIGLNAASQGQGSNSVAIGRSAGSNTQGSASVAIGRAAGSVSQGSNSVAIGQFAGAASQGSNAIAVGFGAGSNAQPANSIVLNASNVVLNATQAGFYANPVRSNAAITGAFVHYDTATKELVYNDFVSDEVPLRSTTVVIGCNAAAIAQNQRAVAVGNAAGSNSQGADSVAIGNSAGLTSQGSNSVAIGQFAGASSQGSNAIAIGFGAGSNSQTPNSIVLNASNAVLNTTQAGFYANPVRSNAAITGAFVHYDTATKELVYNDFVSDEVPLRSTTVVIGCNAGVVAQQTNGVAIGNAAASNAQGSNSVAIGTSAGLTSQGSNSVAIGQFAGASSQGSNAIAIGFGAGSNSQTPNSIVLNASNAVLNTTQAGFYANPVRSNAAITGAFVHYDTATKELVYNNYVADEVPLRSTTVVIGCNAGVVAQQTNGVAIGNAAASNAQGSNSVAIGTSAGLTSQGSNSVAIGQFAGASSQGSNAIAIGFGAGSNSQTPNSIVLNASNAVLNTTQAGFYANPVRSNAAITGAFVHYDTVTKELVYNNYVADEVPLRSTTVVIGCNAGAIAQQEFSIAIGFDAGQSNQGSNSVAIGYRAGSTIQQYQCIAIGSEAGQYGQQFQGVAVGYIAGTSNQRYGGTALGGAAGAYDQNTNATAVGNSAGYSNQGNSAIALGDSAAVYNQQDYAVAIGVSAGYSDQGQLSIAIGENTAYASQSTNSVAIGTRAGYSYQGANAVAIGARAGYQNQDLNGIAIGYHASEISQSSFALAIGNYAGYSNQYYGAIALGCNAGYDTQGIDSVAIGTSAGNLNQGNTSIAIGYNAGCNGQFPNSIAIGRQAGEDGQTANAVAIGWLAANVGQGTAAVAIGYSAGCNLQLSGAVAIGLNAGMDSQNPYGVAIGTNSGKISQGANSVAVGRFAGNSNQLDEAIAIGYAAGYSDQKYDSIAIGSSAGNSNQDSNSIAIGYYAGFSNQGSNAIAIGFGAGSNTQNPNSIVLNANSVELNTSQSGFYVNPIRYESSIILTGGYTYYNTTSKELVYNDRMTISTLTALQALNSTDVFGTQTAKSVDYNFTLFGSNATLRSTFGGAASFASYIAISDDGKYMTTSKGLDDRATDVGYIYRSSDYGSSWVAVTSAGTSNYNGGCMSRSGQYQYAANGGTNPTKQKIRFSTDYGITWADCTNSPAKVWIDVNCSADGRIVLATCPVLTNGVFATDYLYISYDYGNTWTTKNTVRTYIRVDLSLTGQYMLATLGNSSTGVSVSADYGATWNDYGPAFVTSGCSVSATGKYMVCGTNTVGNVYYSSDYGVTWSATSPVGGGGNWLSFSLSDSGQYGVAVCFHVTIPGGFYITTDYGATWTQILSTTLAYGTGISRNGQYFVFTRQSGDLYTGSIQTLFPAGINVLTSTVTSTLTVYNSTIRVGGNELVVNSASKTFVIDHPQDQTKHLVHACLEGPEAGVYYRGKACLSNSGSVCVELPPYVAALAYDFTVQVTPVWNGSALRTLNVSEVHDGKFHVYGEEGSFYWMVHGKRASIEVEPRKADVVVRGDGPYRWISS